MQVYTHLKNYAILIKLEGDLLRYLEQESVSFRVLPVLLGSPFKPGDYILKYKSADNTYIYAIVIHYGEFQKIFITEFVPGKVGNYDKNNISIYGRCGIWHYDNKLLRCRRPR